MPATAAFSANSLRTFSVPSAFRIPTATSRIGLQREAGRVLFVLFFQRRKALDSSQATPNVQGVIANLAPSARAENVPRGAVKEREPGSLAADTRPSLDVIVPVLNEELRLGNTLAAVADELDGLDVDGAIRVIDNGSTDGTLEVVDALCRATPRVSITVQGCATRGKGRAVSRGMVASEADWIGFCDADLATPASAIRDAVAHLRAGWQVVIGSRHLPDSGMVRPRSTLRSLGSQCFRLLASQVVDDIGDTQCGFKFFDGEAARRLFGCVSLNGFAFDVEVLALASDLNMSIKEIPVDWTDRPGSTFRPVSDGLAAVCDVARLRRRLKRPTVVSTSSCRS